MPRKRKSDDAPQRSGLSAHQAGKLAPHGAQGSAKVRYTQPEFGEPAEPLTPRQEEVLSLIAERRSDKEISEKLGVRVRTVQTYRQHIYRSIPARNGEDAVVWYLQRRVANLERKYAELWRIVMQRGKADQ
jgi:DNA-binding NarL/FixJ family response regulator